MSQKVELKTLPFQMVQTRYNVNIPFFLFLAIMFSFLISLFLLELFLTLLSVLWLFEHWKDKKAAFNQILYVVVFFGITRLVSIIFSAYPAESVSAIPKEILFYLGFLSMSFYLRVFDDQKFYTVIFVFTISAVIVAFIGLLQFNLKIVERAQSFTSGYSTFSSYLLASLGLYLILADFIKRKSGYYLWFFGIIIILAGIATSLGRANLFFALIIILAFLLIKRIKVWYVIMAIILASGISYISFLNNSSEVSSRVEAPAQLADRDIILEGAKQIYKEHPILGFGPRTFHQIFPFPERFADKGIGSWHNDFVQIYFEGGLLGEAGFLLMLFVPFITGVKLLKVIKEKRKNSVVLGVILAISGLVLSALFAGFIDSPVLAPVFAFLISVISRESDEVKKVSVQ